MTDQPDPVGTFTSPRSWRILACDCDWWDHDTEAGSLCLRCDTPILSTRVVPQPEPAVIDALAPPANPLSALNALLVQTVALDRHPWMSDDRYQDVQLGVRDATKGLIRALEGWPA